jgi:hypothetical protein
MSPPTNGSRQAAARRRIQSLALPVGIASLAVGLLAVAVVGFVLFGCGSPGYSNHSTRKIEGYIVNPPDPPLSSSRK